jgi:cytidylate kinase
MIIAIDGPAASGKGTLAKRIGAHFGFPVLDTGLLYRAVARDVAAAGQPLDDVRAAAEQAKRLDPASFDDPSLRGGEAGDAASIVARIPEVRAALLDYQREFARRAPGAVLDGRDIGTVVCPDADVKIYVTATPEIRAKRRYLELQTRWLEGAPPAPTYEDVLADIVSRDERDAGRTAAPMKMAADADLLDTSDLDIEAAFDAAVGLIKRKIGQYGTRKRGPNSYWQGHERSIQRTRSNNDLSRQETVRPRKRVRASIGSSATINARAPLRRIARAYPYFNRRNNGCRSS